MHERGLFMNLNSFSSSPRTTNGSACGMTRMKRIAADQPEFISLTGPAKAELILRTA
jgi:hypothetical protein